jgi:flavin-dependent thymidylate synthase
MASGMKIKLAGFNVDYDLLKELAHHHGSEMVLTPEIFSAAYARISRSPMSVTQLRKLAKKEIGRARQSNRTIIFSMGHHSVAEHAVFNFDIMGISRLLAEQIERFRLNSYTEKSQRYIKLEGNYVVPEKIQKSSYSKRFKEIINEGIALYHELYEAIVRCEIKKMGGNPGKDAMKPVYLRANEDARYVLSLSQKTQIGETINARNLELLLRRFASSELHEAKECGKKMYHLVKKIAPSIILFYRENDFDKLTYLSLRNYARMMKKKGMGKKEESVTLIDWTKNADTFLISTILHSVSDVPFSAAFETAKAMGAKKKRDLLKKVFNHLELYHSVLREFEYLHCTFSCIVSASCFAQLKRHRMTTLTCQRYDPDLGVNIPQTVYDAGMEGQFTSFIDRTNKLYTKMETHFPAEAQYLLTNAHRRRVLLSANVRELYHISRLREDKHAQWEIRGVTERMMKLAKRKMPLTLLVIGGKDRYPEIYRSVFGRYPKVIHPVLPS